MTNCRYYSGEASCRFSIPEAPQQGKRLMLPRSCTGKELVQTFVRVGTFDETNPKKTSGRGSRWIASIREYHVGYTVDRDGNVAYLTELDAITCMYVRNAPGYTEWVTNSNYSDSVFRLQRVEPVRLYDNVTVFVSDGLTGPQEVNGDWRLHEDWRDAIEHDYFEQLLSKLVLELLRDK